MLLVMESSWEGVTSLRAAALAMVIVIAGCSGVAVESQDRVTITPAPVPTPSLSPTPDTSELAPGLDRNGVVDRMALVNAHERALQNRSYTVTYTVIRRQEDGVVPLRYTRRARLGADRSRYCFQTRLLVNRSAEERSLERHVQRWSNRTHAYEVVEQNGEARYRVETLDRERGEHPADAIPFDPAHQRGLHDLFRQVNTTVTGWITRNTTTLLRVEDAESAPLPPIENLSLTAEISDTGLIHTYRLTYFVPRDGTRVFTVGKLGYKNIDATTVKRPPWRSRARAGTTTNRSGPRSQFDTEWC